MEILLRLLPHVNQDGFARRHTIGGKLHHERHVLALEQESTEEPGGDDRQANTDHIHQQHDNSTILREEGSRQEHIDRQTGTATHQRQDQHRDHAAIAALDRAGGHDRRHVATESHHQGDERFTVQPHLVHDLIHDEGGSCHIAGILHERDEHV